MALPHHQRAAAFGLGTVLISGAGQTYFIGLFGAALRDAFGLSEAALGTIYGGATLISGLLMFWLGAMADRMPLGRALAIALTCLIAGALVMASAPHPALLLPGFLLLRLGGQGLCGHIGIVAAARHAGPRRGTALSIAAFGFVIGEALWPMLVSASLGLMPWRWVWGGTALVVLVAGWPLLGWLAAPLPPPDAAAGHGTAPLRRRTLMTSPRFLAALSVVLVPPFVITAVFFHQSSVGAVKGWALGDIASAFAAYAAAQATANWFTGRAVDRLGSVAVLRLQLLPLVPAMLALAWLPSGAGPWAVFALLGAMSGASQVNAGALWAELFGTEQMGMVRGVAAAIMVVATALAPPLLGLALGARLPLAAWCLPAAAYAVVVPLLVARVLRRVPDTPT